MATDKIDTLLPLFNDLNGSPLENGSIYIGEVNKNPSTNPISIYWDKDKTIPASQPLTTISGYISRNGTPANIYIESNFSVTVKNSNDSIIFTELNNEFSDFKNFQDDEFTISNGTKSFRFNAFYISANEERVLEVQDKDGTIALTEDIEDVETIIYGIQENLLTSLIMLPISTVPSGYLECDGSAISRITYAALFALLGETFGVGDGSTTFNIPDFRAEFPRGWDNGRGIDIGRTLGSYQDDAFQGHHHNITNDAAGITPDNVDIGGGTAWDWKGYASVTDPITDGVNGIPRTSSETRPRNIAVMFCIKY